MKQGNTFAVLDRFGDIHTLGQGKQGIYHSDTRFLSRLELRLKDGHLPVILNSTIKEDNSLLTIDLTTPDIYHNGQLTVPQDTVHIFRAKLLWKDIYHEHLRFVNYGQETVTIDFIIEFESDFKDIFEVRGATRDKRGEQLTPIVTKDSVTLGYRGLDEFIRETQILFTDPHAMFSEKQIRFSVTLAVQEEKSFYLTVKCIFTGKTEHVEKTTTYDDAAAAAASDLQFASQDDCKIHTSNEQYNDWLNRSAADLHLLVSDTTEGPYPYAGVPWFSTPFGRDGIITALGYLWVNPEISRGVLSYLAANQATEIDPDSDAEPGKILHETRNCEMALLGEVPFAKYYGSMDSTPLFLVLAGKYYQRTGDLSFIKRIWPNIQAALQWIDNYGDKDGDGFFEYLRQTPSGLSQQGWKDSDDSISHADGTLAEGAIALCEVQAYVYEAWLLASGLAIAMSDNELADRLTDKAEALKEKFNQEFWCEDIETYVIALDGDKKQCKVKSSNAGHTLYSGIASLKYAERVANTLLSDHSFSGWGIRTLAEGEARYNPMSYHNGAVWPHDNAMILLGFSRYDMQQNVSKVITGLFNASLFLDLHRLPELFCSFRRFRGAGPTLYPVACSPQAWATTVAFSCLQACLGLVISGTPVPRIDFVRPFLPDYIDFVELKNIQIAGTSTDLQIRRHEQDVGVIVLRRVGDVLINVVK